MITTKSPVSELLSFFSLCTRARVMFQHDQFEASLRFIEEASERLGHLRADHPASSEYIMALKAYNIVRREYELALPKEGAVL